MDYFDANAAIDAFEAAVNELAEHGSNVKRIQARERTRTALFRALAAVEAEPQPQPQMQKEPR